MYQEKDQYRLLIKNLPDGLVYCKVVLDSSGKPLDYIFLEVNSSFEALTGFPRENVIGKKLTEVLPGIKGLGLDLVNVFGQVAATGQSTHFQQYLDQQDRWYEITAYSDQPGYSAVVFHDITENKKTEEELRQRERNFSTLVENTPDMIVRFNLDLQHIYFNAAVEHQLGIPVHRFIGKTFLEIDGSPEQLKFMHQLLQKALETGEEQQTEQSFPTLFGQKYFQTRIVPERDEKGIIESLLSVSRDITERKQAEEALQESDKIFKQFMENSPNYVFFKNDKDQAIRLSSNYEKMLGKPMHELLGKTMDDLFPSDLAKSMIADDLRVLNEGKQITIEEELNGRFYTTIKFPILVKGKPRYLAGYTMDITERKQAEEALRESEERYRTLFERTANPILIIDAEGNYLRGNETALQFLECTREELLSKNVRDTLPPGEQATEVMRKLMPLWESGGRTEREYYVNGKIKVLDLTISPCMWNGKRAIFGLGTDITERKKMEGRERYSKEVLLAIRKVNQLIVQETDPEHLIDQSCQILTETLGYYNAWIALLDEGGKVTSTAASGFDDGFTIFEEHLKQGKYPPCMNKALEDEGIAIIDNLLDNCADCPLSPGHVGRAGLSGCIQYGDKLYGTLSVSIPSEYANLEETSKLFIELASDLGLAFYKIALEKERKQAEEALYKSERNLAAIMNASTESIFLMDLEGDLLAANESLAQRLGTDLETLLRGNFYEFLPSDVAKNRKLHVKQVIKSGKPLYFEDEGFGRTILNSFYPIFDSKGQINRLAVIGMDITERKQAELLILVQRDLTMAISFSHQLDKALLQCLDTIIQLSEMECGGIYLIDQASGDLNLICHRNLSPTFIKSVSHYKADSTYARLVLQGKPLFTRYSELDLPLNQDDFAEKLRAFAVLPLIFENRVIGCLNLASKKLEDVSEINRKVLKNAVTLMGEGITRLKTEEELKLSYQKLQKAIKNTIQAMALILEKRDPYTAGHQERVTKLACAIAEEINLSPEKIEGLYMAGIIHDIGKINIPTEILSKPGRLSEIELSLIKTHPQVGSDILKEMELPGEISSIVLQHHERMDGSGYPSGLSGKDITLEARILAVADIVEAMASHRPYRPALGLDKALKEITQNKGKLYDPEVVDACLKLFKEKGFKFE